MVMRHALAQCGTAESGGLREHCHLHLRSAALTAESGLLRVIALTTTVASFTICVTFWKNNSAPLELLNVWSRLE